MSHKGNIVLWSPTPEGPRGEIIIDDPRDRTARRRIDVSRPGGGCDACGMYDNADDYYAIEVNAKHCELHCISCERTKEQHADDRCLFGPTRYRELRYKITTRTFPRRDW